MRSPVARWRARMPSSLRGALQPPTFDDPEKARTASVLHRILVAVGIAVVLQLVTSPLLGPAQVVGAALSGVVLVAAVVALAQLRRGRVRGVVIGFSVVSWLAVTSSVVIFGGDVGASALFYLVVLLLVGLIWSERAVLAFCAASIVATLAVTLLVGSGHLSRLGPEGSPAAGWYALTVALCLTAALLNLALGSVRDALASSRRSERKLAELVAAAPDGILSLDAEGRIESANPAAERIFGRLAAELVGTPLPKTESLERAGAVRLARALDAVQRDDTPGPLELDVIRANGSRVPVELTLRPLEEGNGGAGVQLTLRDQSERRRAMEEHERLEERLRHAQKMEAVGQLAGGVAHDFNNYLTVVLSNAELLLAELSDRAELASGVAEITEAVQRAATLTQQLLVFSRKQEFHPRVVEPCTLVGNMRRLLERAVGEQVELKIHETGDVGAVLVDPAQLEVAILNLAINARDAMPEGGELSIAVSKAEIGPDDLASLSLEAPAGSYAMISVSDHGQGIESRVLDRIFEPFFTTKEEGRGTGLGLSTVYGIVQKSGGALTVESALGSGTTFRIFLPVHDQAEEAPATAPERGNELARGSGTILLVEDDHGVRKMLRELLSAHGYRVLEACDGEDALRLAQTHGGRIDLLLTDVIMPRRGGADLSAALAAGRSDLATLYMSGYTDGARIGGDDSRERALIRKPFTASQLLGQVKDQIDRARRAAPAAGS